MTAGPSGDDNQNTTYEAERFQKFMASLGTRVKRMGTPQELASVSIAQQRSWNS